MFILHDVVTKLSGEQMLNLVLLSENPAFIAVITAFTLLLLFIGFVCFNLLNRLNNLEKSLETIERVSADTAANFLNLCVRWDGWIENFEKFDKKNNQAILLIEQIRYEQELLTKVLGSENKLSKAIELARSGSGVDEIMLKAGVSSDEAIAVVKFHGPNEVDH